MIKSLCKIWIPMNLSITSPWVSMDFRYINRWEIKMTSPASVPGSKPTLPGKLQPRVAPWHNRIRTSWSWMEHATNHYGLHKETSYSLHKGDFFSRCFPSLPSTPIMYHRKREKSQQYNREHGVWEGVQSSTVVTPGGWFKWWALKGHLTALIWAQNSKTTPLLASKSTYSQLLCVS